MAEPLDGARMLRDAAEIAFPRAAGSAGDARARAILARRLADAGLEVVEEVFSYDLRPALRAIRGVLLTSAAFVAVAALLAPARPLAAAGLLGVGLLAGTALLGWAPGAERLYGGPGPRTTANLAGFRRAAQPRLRLVLLAHHDSKSQNLTFPWRIGLTCAALVGGAVLLLLLLAGAVWGMHPAAAAACRATGLASAAALVALSTLRSENHSPGGVDNAGSVAVVDELARRLPARVPADVELVFLHPGAEEDHMVGAMRWLDARRTELERCPTLALNFDGAGAPGRLVAIERYGFGRAFAPRVAEVAREEARRLDEPLRSIWLPPAVGVDGIPFDHRGVPCLTLSSGALGRAVLAVHSPGDVAANLDGPTLERTARLAEAVALRLTR